MSHELHDWKNLHHLPSNILPKMLTFEIYGIQISYNHNSEHLKIKGTSSNDFDQQIEFYDP